MTLLTAVQVADYWIGAGGPKDRAVEWVAIAMGESGLDDSAVSPVGAIGIWQIMPFNAGPYGYTPAQLYDPAVNARVAVAMSGGGANCAAWDSCYANIYASGRYSFLAYPEQGSADYNNLAAAQAELAGTGLHGIGDPGQPGIDGTLPASIAKLGHLLNTQIPAVEQQFARRQREVKTLYRAGWKP